MVDFFHIGKINLIPLLAMVRSNQYISILTLLNGAKNWKKRTNEIALSPDLLILSCGTRKWKATFRTELLSLYGS